MDVFVQKDLKQKHQNEKQLNWKSNNVFGGSFCSTVCCQCILGQCFGSCLAIITVGGDRQEAD